MVKPIPEQPKLIDLPTSDKVPVELRYLYKRAAAGDLDARFNFALELDLAVGGLDIGVGDIQDPTLSMKLFEEIAQLSTDRQKLEVFIRTLCQSSGRSEAVICLANSWFEEFNPSVLQEQECARTLLEYLGKNEDARGWVTEMATSLIKTINAKDVNQQNWAQWLISLLDKLKASERFVIDLAAKLLKNFNAGDVKQQNEAKRLIPLLKSLEMADQFVTELAAHLVKDFIAWDVNQQNWARFLMSLLEPLNRAEQFVIDLAASTAKGFNAGDVSQQNGAYFLMSLLEPLNKVEQFVVDLAARLVKNFHAGNVSQQDGAKFLMSLLEPLKRADQFVIDLAAQLVENFNAGDVNEQNWAKFVMSLLEPLNRAEQFVVDLTASVAKNFNWQDVNQQDWARFLISLPDPLKRADQFVIELAAHLKDFNWRDVKQQNGAKRLVSLLKPLERADRFVIALASRLTKNFNAGDVNQRDFVVFLAEGLSSTATPPDSLLNLCASWLGGLSSENIDGARLPRRILELLLESASDRGVSRQAVMAARASGLTDLILPGLLSEPASAARNLRLGLTFIEAGRVAEGVGRLRPTGLADVLQITRARCLFQDCGGCNVQQFHKACDGKGPTLVIFESTGGEVFGGYTPVPWSSQGGNRADASNTSFLFILQSEKLVKPIILKLKKPERAVVHDANSGPSFGGYLGVCWDLNAYRYDQNGDHVRDSCGGYIQGCSVGYLRQAESYATAADPDYWGVNRNFYLRSVEVWRVRLEPT